MEIHSNPISKFSHRELELISRCKEYVVDSKMMSKYDIYHMAVVICKLIDVVDAMRKDLNFEVEESPSLALFNTLGEMMEEEGVDLSSINSEIGVVEAIAAAQGRDVIFSCPDGMYRNKDREVIYKKADSLHGTAYWGCVPYTFKSVKEFIDWIGEPAEVPDGATDVVHTFFVDGVDADGTDAKP